METKSEALRRWRGGCPPPNTGSTAVHLLTGNSRTGGCPEHDPQTFTPCCLVLEQGFLRCLPSREQTTHTPTPPFKQYFIWVSATWKHFLSLLVLVPVLLTSQGGGSLGSYTTMSHTVQCVSMGLSVCDDPSPTVWLAGYTGTEMILVDVFFSSFSPSAAPFSFWQLCAGGC